VEGRRGKMKLTKEEDEKGVIHFTMDNPFSFVA
jgi:hypothetical protein